jgi:large subunit ribosomal protein L15
VRLHELSRFIDQEVDLAALKQAHVVPRRAKRAKVILSGKLEGAVTLRGIAVTAGARQAIEQAGGRVEA